MKKKWLLCSVSLSLIALLLIGCGGTTGESAVLPESPSEEQSVPSPESPSEEQPAPSPEQAVPDSESTTEPQPPASTPEEPAPESPSGTIPWTEAKNHIGEEVRVCGPVISTKYDREVAGKPTFLYVGKPDGFVVVIWDKYRSKFPEPPEHYYLGKTICVGGEITEDKGIPQIEILTHGQIQVQTESK